MKELRFIVANTYIYKLVDEDNNPDIGFRILRTKYQDDGVEYMLVDYPKFTKYADYFYSKWDEVKVLSLSDLVEIAANPDKRRAIFSILPLSLVYKNHGIEIVSETITMIQDWGKSTVDMTFTLVKAPTDKLYPDVSKRNIRIPFVYAVKMQCPSTDIVYYAQVPTDADFVKNPDPVAAVAWLVRPKIPYDKIEYIVRQGDIITVIPYATKERITYVEPYHLNKDQYISKLVFQS